MPTSTQTNPVVLHVDDDQQILDVGSASLRQETNGLTVIGHDNPEEALELLSSMSVDCVVSDSIQMADGTPFVARARELNTSVPIVLFTGSEWGAVAETAESIEAASYVRKGSPDAVAELSRRVDGLLGGSEPTEPPRTLEDGWTVIGRHDWGSMVDLSTTLTESVTAHTALDIEDLPPLFDSVDTDAMTVLLSPRGYRGLDETDTHVEARFEWAEYELLVTRDGIIEIRSREE